MDQVEVLLVLQNRCLSGQLQQNKLTELKEGDNSPSFLLKQMSITNRENNKGFTLIELLIVMSIIAILGTIGITAYVGSSLKAARSEAYANLEALRLLEEQFNAENANYTGSLASLPGFLPGPAANYTYALVAPGAALPAGAVAVPYDGATVGATNCFIATATGNAGTRVAGDVFAHMAGNHPRVGVEAPTGSPADDDTNGFPLVKRFLSRGRGGNYAKAQRGEKHRPQKASLCNHIRASINGGEKLGRIVQPGGKGFKHVRVVLRIAPKRRRKFNRRTRAFGKQSYCAAGAENKFLSFVAQTTPAYINHFYKAIIEANEYPGPALVNVYSTCQPEHGVADDLSAQQAGKEAANEPG